MTGGQQIALCAVLILTLAIAGFVLRNAKPPVTVIPGEALPERLPSTPAPTAEASLFAVHIVGCVHHPGVIWLPAGSLVLDAVEAAGGFTQEADQEAINLAYALTGHVQLRVPSLQEEDKTWLRQTGSTAGGEAEQRLNINTAGASQLMTLPGIGAVLAANIVSYREENGRFSSIEELMNVPGIKQAKFDALKDSVTV